MIDRIFAPVLTFLMLIGGTAAIASSLFGSPQAELLAQRPAAAPLMLEPVVITVSREAAEKALAEHDRLQATSRAAESRGAQL